MRALEHALRIQAVRSTKRLRPRKWPRPKYPTNERLYYYRQLLHVVETLQYFVQRDLLPQLPRILGAHIATRPEARTDAADADIEVAFAAVAESAARAIPEQQIQLAVQQSALRTAKWNGNELTKQVQQVAKVNLFDDTTGLAVHLDLFVAENVALVKSLGAAHLDDLKGIVTRAARSGLHHTEVAQQIMQRFDMPKKRAALIATDQIGKLNGELNQLRQQNLGVRRYRWSSSQDERVRKRHRELNGQVFEWAKPPVIDERTGQRGHPGQAIRCRCAPIPIIDDVLVDAGLMDPADVELTQPKRGAQPTLRPVALPPGPTPLIAPVVLPPGPPRLIAPVPKPLPVVPPDLPLPPPANLPDDAALQLAAAKRVKDEAARAKRKAAAQARRAAKLAEKERLERERQERIAQRAAQLAAIREAEERAEAAAANLSRKRVAAEQARAAADVLPVKRQQAAGSLGPLARKVFGKHLTDGELDALLGLDQRLPDGITAEIATIREEYGEVTVRAVFKQEGKAVGNLVREYHRNPKTGETSVHHAFFEISRSLQGNKIGAKVFNAQIEAYKRTGLVQRVKLEAAWVGQYAWTKAGFEWTDRKQIAQLMADLRKRLRAMTTPAAARRIMERVKTPLDVAGVEVGGERVGKDLLVNYSDDLIPMHQTPAKLKPL